MDQPGVPYVSVTSTGAGLTSAVINRPEKIHVSVLNISADPSIPSYLPFLSAQLFAPGSTCATDCDIKKIRDGHLNYGDEFEVTYTPVATGQHFLRITFADRDCLLPPYKVQVFPDAPRHIVNLDAWHVGICKDGFVAVTDSDHNKISVLNLKNKVVKSFGSYGSSDGQFRSAAGVAMVRRDYILVVDEGNNRLHKFLMSDGTFHSTVGSFGNGKCQFNRPNGICIHPSGKVIVADCGNDRIQVLDIDDLSFSHSFGRHGYALGNLRFPRSVATDSRGIIYVSDHDNHRIQAFTLEGTFLRQIKYGKTDEDGLQNPNGIAISADDLVYVAERKRISVFNTNGDYVGKIEDEAIDGPMGLAFDHVGRLYVCNTGTKQLLIY